MTVRSALAATSASIALLVATQALAHHPGGAGGATGAGPINTIAASTLEQGRTVVGVTFEYLSLGGLVDAGLLAAADADIHVHSMRSIVSPSLNVAYGLSNDLMLSVRLPYIERKDIREGHHHMGMSEVEERGDASGLGDLSVFAQWRFLGGAGSGPEVALVLGVKAPTGRDDIIDRNGEPFEAEFLPGAGAWDGSAGLAVTQRAGAWSFDASALYTAVGEGVDDTRLGDRVHYNLAASVRVLGAGTGMGSAMGAPMYAGTRSHDHGDGGSGRSHVEAATGGPAIDLVLEINGEWHDRQEIAGTGDPNSGGHTLYLAPGVRVSQDAWSGFVSVGIPVADEVNGIQSEPQLRIVSGASVGF